MYKLKKFYEMSVYYYYYYDVKELVVDTRVRKMYK